VTSPTPPRRAGRRLSPGVWGVLATPFSDGGRRVDLASLRAEVALYGGLAGEGVAGVVALGVFGEAGSLSMIEQEAVVAEVVAASPVPVVAGLSARASAPAIEQALRLAEAAGGRLEALMVQVASGHLADAARTFDEIHEAVGIPILVQDYPVASGVAIRPERLGELVADRPYVVGVKCEAPPTAAAIALFRERVRVPCFGGLGGVGLVDELAAGAAGAMTGFSCPEGLLAAVRAFTEGGFAAARGAFSPWLPLANFEGQPGVGLAIRKEILRRRGVIAESCVRPPAPAIPSSLLPRLAEHLATLPPPVVPIH
jgi:4-hydroxy-tetrahydrodipicolinate synthase